MKGLAGQAARSGLAQERRKGLDQFCGAVGCGDNASSAVRPIRLRRLGAIYERSIASVQAICNQVGILPAKGETQEGPVERAACDCSQRQRCARG